MAITNTVTKIGVSLKLNNGVDDKGNVKTVSLSLGSLNKSNFDDDKAYSVVEKLTPCLSKTLYGVQKTVTSTLSK